jgi:hypothetical protein
MDGVALSGRGLLSGQLDFVLRSASALRLMTLIQPAEELTAQRNNPDKKPIHLLKAFYAPVDYNRPWSRLSKFGFTDTNRRLTAKIAGDTATLFLSLAF